MSRNPKCNYCGEEVDKKTGHYIEISKKKHWFCNLEEYQIWQAERDANADFRFDVRYLFDTNISTKKESSWNMFNSYLNSLLKRYSRDELIWYFDCNMEKLASILRKKDFDSEYGMMRYLITVIGNNIDSFLENVPVPSKKDNIVQAEDFYMAPINYRPSNIRRAMSFIEQTEDEDG